MKAPQVALERPGGRARLLPAFRLMTSTSLLTILFGAATTKVIALVAGLEGIALMGLYRNLASLVSRPLGLGFDTIIVQRISTASDDRDVPDVLGATALLIAFQSLVVLAIAGCAGPLARWAFGTGAAAPHVAEVRVVLAMAFANLLLQLVTAVLNGSMKLGRSAALGVLAAASSLALIAPLLRLGSLGLAINAGSGSVVGGAVGVLLILKIHGRSLGQSSLTRSWRVLRRSVAPSFLLTLHPIVMIAGLLSVQSLVNQEYGIKGLGAYFAAAVTLDTGVMVLMSSVKSYYLPALGQFGDGEDKSRFVADMLALLIGLAVASSALLIVGARPLMRLLFSDRFAAAADLVGIFGLSLVGQALIWSYNAFLVHRAGYWLVFALDAVWIGLLVAGVALVCLLRLPLEAVAWVYALSYSISGLMYALVTVWAHGATMLTRRNAALAASAYGLVALLYATTRVAGMNP